MSSIQINKHEWPLKCIFLHYPNTFQIVHPYMPICSKTLISITYRVQTDIILFLLVVTQFYDTDVNKAYAIRGNSVIIKCETPSYVTDFLTVVSWHTDNGDVYYPGNNNGIIFGGVHYLNLIKIGFIIEISSVSYLIFHSTTPNNMTIKLNYYVCVYSV